jgi:glycosyltransferase involved in cell wall biosynthesis
MKRVSIYFAAGDFYEALRRFDEGLSQFYQTHDEIAKLVGEFSKQRIHTTIFSLVTPARRERTFGDYVRIVDLGENSFTASASLISSVREVPADAIVAHYATPQLLRASLGTKARIFPILASTDNRTGLRAWVRRKKYIRLLNHPRFDLVANHCMPATRQLAAFGVKKEKLVAWDIAHPFHPREKSPKLLPTCGPFQIFFAGSINESKGVGDLIRALPVALAAGADVRYVLAGRGSVDSMQALARTLGVDDKVAFAGMLPNAEVRERMADADVVVIPSRAEFPEGFPLTMFEAISSRSPIVCSDHPVFRDLFLDGRDVALFKQGDSASLACALVRVLRDADLYHRLSLNAESTWKLLDGPADWRTLVKTWLFEGANAPWIQRYVLSNS